MTAACVIGNLSSPTPSSLRRQGPITLGVNCEGTTFHSTAYSFALLLCNACLTRHRRHGVWVPASAGTTLVMRRGRASILVFECQTAAVIADMTSHSRDAIAPEVCDERPALWLRGRAERRTRDASAASCAKVKAHELVATKAPDASGVPHAVRSDGVSAWRPR